LVSGTAILGLASSPEKTPTKHPYRIVEKLDSHTGEYVVKFQIRKPPPLKLSILVGDCLYSLRSSLDHLAYSLLIKALAGKPIPSKILTASEFPIFRDPVKYRSKRVAIIGGIEPRAQAKIDALQPYNGRPNNRIKSLWILNQLTNVDKHRTFNLTYSYGIIGMGGGPRPVELAPDDDIEVDSFDVQVGGPLKNQTEIIRYRAFTKRDHRQVRMNFNVSPFVVFSQRPVKGVPVLEVLMQIINCIEKDVFPVLKPFL
jgi:hypothetical protein